MWKSYLISLEIPPTEKRLQYYKILHEYFHGHIFEWCYSYLPNSTGGLASNTYLAMRTRYKPFPGQATPSQSSRKS